MDRRAWQDYSPWGCNESDMTEQLTLLLFTSSLSCIITSVFHTDRLNFIYEINP